MKTSYFGRANSKNFKDRGIRFVSVARSCRYWSGEKYPDLFPTWEMIKMEDEEEYDEITYELGDISHLRPTDFGRITCIENENLVGAINERFNTKSLKNMQSNTLRPILNLRHTGGSMSLTRKGQAGIRISTFRLPTA